MQVRVGDVIDFDEHHSVLDMLTFNRVTGVYFELRGDGFFGHCYPPATSWDAWASRRGARVRYGCGPQYVQPLHFYLNTLNRLPREIERVVIVAGSHWPLSKDGRTHIGNRSPVQGIELRSFDKSWQLLMTLREPFTERGYPRSLRVGQNADEDLIYMSHAKYFLPSSGGFSAVVSNVARMNGAQIIR